MGGASGMDMRAGWSEQGNPTMQRRMRHRRRRGNVLVLFAFLLVPLFAMLVFAIDIGYLLMARAQLQVSADAAAMAGAWELLDANALAGQPNTAVLASNARTRAGEFAGYNKVCADAPALAANNNNSTLGDVVLGYLPSLTDPTATMDYSGNNYNSVQVTVRRDLNQNGEIRLFFAPILGFTSRPMQAQATAALLIDSVAGFRTPGDGTNVELLPFALDEDTWNDMLAGGGSDGWRWNEGSKTVTSGNDGIREVNLFPQGTGSPGNRGTVDIGSNNNSTADLARQIVYGVNQADLAYHGGELRFNSQGKLFLNGDTGISAGVKDELASIIGKPRTIPIFRSVSGPGNNATYTIVKFVGVRILEVKLTGSMSSKRVTVQPANVVAKGTIAGSTTGTSQFIYSPVRLVR